MILDKRYQKTEEQILRLFFIYGDTITIERMAKILGVSRSTIYRHHKSLKEMINYYTKMVIDECKGFCNENAKRFYVDLLIYIIKNKEAFLMFYKMKDWRAFLVVLEMNEGVLMKNAGYKQRVEKVFNIYEYEVVAVMNAWGEKEFNRDDFDVVLGDILFLTKNMKVRLGPLEYN